MFHVKHWMVKLMLVVVGDNRPRWILTFVQIEV